MILVVVAALAAALAAAACFGETYSSDQPCALEEKVVPQVEVVCRVIESGMSLGNTAGGPTYVDGDDPAHSWGPRWAGRRRRGLESVLAQFKILGTGGGTGGN